VLVTHGRLARAGPQDIEHSRTAGLSVRRRPGFHQARIGEQAEMPADRVLVQTETPGQLADVVTLRYGAQLLDDPHTVRIGHRTADGELVHLNEIYR
jgi:hypothetical protein